jgi:hypothetical protein
LSRARGGTATVVYRRRIRNFGSSRRALVLVAVALVIPAAACSNDDGEAVVDVGNDAVGTCLKFDDDIGENVTKLPAVPCEESHSHEIFAVVQSDAETYPGFEELEAEAQALCLGEFEEYVGVSAFDSELFYSWLVPTLNSWDKENDREIICVVGEQGGAPLTGSVRDINR